MGFSILIQALSARVPMQSFEVTGQKMSRVAKFVPKFDGKERLLYWRGDDPEKTEIDNIVDDLIFHLDLQSTSKT